MFKKPFNTRQPNNTDSAGNGSASSSSTSYPFAQPGNSLSSASNRKRQEDNIYQPLPAPTRPGQSQSPGGGGAASPSPRTPDLRGSYGSNNNTPRNPPLNTFNTPSPSASNPLLAGASPIDSHSRFAGMPNPGRYGPTSRMASGATMPRGDSQSTLLGSGERAPSAARRYGPTASSVPVGPNAALLGSPAQSVNDKPPVGADSAAWNSGMDGNNPEADDYLHNPDPRRDKRSDRGGTIFTVRGITNVGCLVVLGIGIISLFAGYPIITAFTTDHMSTNGGYNLGGINSTGQVPKITNFPSLIDPDTPSSAYTRTGYDGEAYSLAFSDEFNKDGRTFFEGDDPFWTGADLHYWPTTDFEWYDPSAITTSGGNLVVTMDQEPIHDLNFKSGMLQSWNQLCFQYSVYLEVRVSLPGTPAVGGFWPGVWMMGNLGRPGYGASTDGMWPYTYDSCDVGTLANQTNAAGTSPADALTTGANGGPISFLPGQRASACTCKGEDHPGPDVSYGRGVPEIDVLEGQTDLSIPQGQVSQSAQVAPFDNNYQPNNDSASVTQYDLSLTKWNTYQGGLYQQAVSSLTYIPSTGYQLTSQDFAVYGFEYYANPNDRSGGHITWVSNGEKSWTMNPSAVGPNTNMQIGQRLISEEPMALVINFGMSNGFQTVDFDHLTWPAQMLVDYVRVYQRSDGKVGCDPADRPTAAYITAHENAYTDPNLTTWKQAGYGIPKNSLIDSC